MELEEYEDAVRDYKQLSDAEPGNRGEYTDVYLLIHVDNGLERKKLTLGPARRISQFITKGGIRTQEVTKERLLQDTGTWQGCI